MEDVMHAFPSHQPSNPLADAYRSLRKRIRSTVHVAWRIGRGPFLFWLITLVLAVATSTMIDRAQDPYPKAWGPLVEVAVAAEPVSAGTVISAPMIRVQRIPSLFVPDRPARGVADVVGRSAVSAIRQNAPVDLAEASPASTSAVSAAIGRGKRGVGLSPQIAPPGLAVGDFVDVLVVADADGSVVATFRNAAVIAIDTSGVLVSLPVAQADRLAAARSVGVATLTLVGG
jgi:Flp pilus assembly protein CpaB